MATDTYYAISEYSVPTATTSVTLSDVGVGYTDLELVINASTVSGTAELLVTFNGVASTGTNYSASRIYSVGAVNSADRLTRAYAGDVTATPGVHVLRFLNFGNTVGKKSFIARGGLVNSAHGINLGSFDSTSAITSITLSVSTGQFAVGSTFSLMGVKAESTVATTKANGGNIYADADYFYHVFGKTGTFTPLQSLTADILVVAGGGGGGAGQAGNHYSGGGGAGGLLTFASQSLSATGYTVTVGAGGAGGNGPATANGSNGSNSRFGSLTECIGGGGGGSNTNAGNAGGSGGGGGGINNADPAGGAGTAGQGFAGGQGIRNYNGGGGGGAGAVGFAGIAGVGGGGGGIGATSSLIDAMGRATGQGDVREGNVYFAGGGSAADSAYDNGFQGAFGGGGSAIYFGTTPVGQGLPATGGGGAGGTAGNANFSEDGGQGGSGIVIVRYAKV
jgi:hypothetical protein